MDIVKFTIRPQNESEMNALIEEINTNTALSESEKRQLMEELNAWSKTDEDRSQ